MIEWLQEINWLMIMTVSIVVVTGTAFGRRSAETKGEIYSFLPLWTNRILNMAMCFTCTLFVEAARVAVKIPNSFSVWMLIFAAAASLIVVLAFFGLELNSAKRALKQATVDAGHMARTAL